MTNDLARAIEATRSLPPERQDELARLMMLFAGEESDDPVCDLTRDEEAALRVGLEQADRGQFATDEQMQHLRTRYGW